MWIKVGDMSKERSFPAVSIIDFDKFKEFASEKIVASKIIQSSSLRIISFPKKHQGLKNLLTVLICLEVLSALQRLQPACKSRQSCHPRNNKTKYFKLRLSY